MCFFSDVLNGVITGEKVHRSMKRLGNCRLQMWNIIISHLKALVEKSSWSAEELSRYSTFSSPRLLFDKCAYISRMLLLFRIYTAALVFHTPRGDEQQRAERKVM